MEQKSQFRSAVQADRDAIADLHAASWRNAYRDALSPEYLAGDVVGDRRRLWDERLTQPDGHQHVVVAHQGELLLGFACVYSGSSEIWGSLLDNIHVAQGLQRTGLGSALLGAIAGHCLQRAPRAGLFLWVLQDNLAAQGFYKKHGASNVGADMWDAPGGTVVPRFRFAWQATGLRRLASLAAEDMATILG